MATVVRRPVILDRIPHRFMPVADPTDFEADVMEVHLQLPFVARGLGGELNSGGCYFCQRGQVIRR